MKNVSTPSISSFSIIKGSLIEETYAAFQSWDLSQSKSENLRHIRHGVPKLGLAASPS